MPTIQFKSNGISAMNLYHLSTKLEGGAEEFKAREKVRSKILKTWPELEIADAKGEEEIARRKALEETRNIDVTPTEQTALAEGFLKYLQHRETSDAEKRLALDLAKMLKFPKWLDKQTDKTPLREFTESDEAPEIEGDAEPEKAAA